jgi:hypothetical protein
MNEESARQKIRAAYHRLREYRGGEDDTKEYGGSIDYHLDAIRSSSDGQWNEAIAKAYVQNLETQLEEETEESAPSFRREMAEDVITSEATDDPLRELGVSRNGLRDELSRLDPDGKDDEAYDSEDMREYIEDADDAAGEDERYRYRD